MDSGVGPDEYSKQIFTVTSYEQTKIKEIQYLCLMQVWFSGC